MLAKIEKELNDFTEAIKDVEGCDKLLNYMNSGIYSSIKLLMFTSKTFAIVLRVMMFCIISISGLLMLSSVGAISFNIVYLVAIDLILLFIILSYIVKYKKTFFRAVFNKKEYMKTR